MKLTKLAAIVVCAVLSVVLSGCFGPSRVTLATLDTPEAVLAGEIMALQLEDFDFEVVRGPRYQSLAELEAGMRAGEFDLSAVYLQDVLTGFSVIAESPIFDQLLAEEIVNNTIGDLFGYTLLDNWWSLNASYTLLMRERFAHDENFSFGALARYAPELTLAAPQEFLEGTGGLAHMRELFGVLEFGEIRVIEASELYEPARIDADIIAVRANIMGNRFLEADFFTIGDNVAIWPANNFYPVASVEIMERMPEIRAILSSISFQIDNFRFAQSVHAISQGEQTPELAAYEILQAARTR